MSDLTHPCACTHCTPRPDATSEPGEALEVLRRRWALAELTRQAEELRLHETTDDTRTRRHWRRWLKVPHLHSEGER